MRVRRAKPYVCVDCDYAEHFSFLETKDIDAAAGVAPMPRALEGPRAGWHRQARLAQADLRDDL